ncbi:glycosyltransferase family 4 protein [Frankia sp. CiP3]|uniref:glycosyltransferase family 4 protein n=1 Tax=Frankia sp. CiP3 TaxID=2880971 RepID=UPI001EF43BBB|nr:glycosyltransferase family 4 protein [Frankia sp. CiP3]
MPAIAAPAGGLGRQLDALAGRHVVFLNWRDLEHPQAGGAELYCQSVAERFAAAGARVSLLTSRPAGTRRSQIVRGITINRSGGTFGVYPATLARLLRDRHSIDAVVDCQNGIPFFSPLVLPATPVVQILHHVHQRQFPLYFPAPVARIGQLLETPGSRWVYRRCPVAVVSPSTRDEAWEILRLRGPRFIVPGGVDTPRDDGPSRPADRPTIVCVGRLVPHKRLHLLLDALPALRAAHPGLVVDLVGDGPDRERLGRHAAGLGLGDDVVRWHGYVEDRQRDQLLSTAWLTVNPSHGEGWGLSVLEANAHGVPAVAFRVPGLRDAVRHGHTGWLADDADGLGPTIDMALSALADPVTAARWRDRARAWAACFSWDATAELLARVVTTEIDRLSSRAPGRHPRESRRADLLVTRAEFPLPSTQALPALRRTDLIYRNVPDRDEPYQSGTGRAGDGSDRAVAVLYGAGPADARAALDRAGVTGPIEVRTATGEDLLIAAVRCALPDAVQADSPVAGASSSF